MSDFVGLSEEECARYKRQLALREIGVQGQELLKKAKVLVVGAGGLGSPILLYLAAAGVGTIGIVDNDFVDESNLQRQVLYNSFELDKSKALVSKCKLEQLNPFSTFVAYPIRLTQENAIDIVSSYDLVVDGTDNFLTKYLINDTCITLGKPWVYGSIFRFEGQLSVFNYTARSSTKGPCYRCLYPELPPASLFPAQAEGLVLGILPGIIGCMQASEVLKIIVGFGEVLTGELLIFNALTASYQKLAVRSSLCCPCSQNHKKNILKSDSASIEKKASMCTTT